MTPPRPGSKLAAVLAALCRRNGLTTAEAFSQLGETMLPSSVHALRRKGYHIVGKPLSGTTRYGRSCHYLRYSATKTSKGTTP